MAKLVIEIELKENPSDNDIIRYNKEKKKWEVIDYVSFNKKLYEERNKLREEIKTNNYIIHNELNKIKEELKLHKDALKILTGGKI